MARSAIIFGGTGYIGERLALHLLEQGWARVVLADIKPPQSSMPGSCEFVACDVRRPIETQIGKIPTDWIFNFAAIHREPGHEYREYFDTNIPGARNVCAYADLVGCGNILFTSSIAVYGDIERPTDERGPIYPNTAYGISKLCAEIIHEGWRDRAENRRLVVVRPGVVYGPGDPGNIGRMIRAVRRGIFVMPGSGAVRKSYAYVAGLIESIEFVLARPEPCLCYNYVERDTEPLRELVGHVASLLGMRQPRMRVPLPVLVVVASIAQAVTRGRSHVHPVRVRKAAKSTHVLPAELLRLGFKFRYDFPTSLRHWMSAAPEDFGPGSRRSY